MLSSMELFCEIHDLDDALGKGKALTEIVTSRGQLKCR